MLWIFSLLGCTPCQPIQSAPPHSPVLCSDVFDEDRVLDVRIEIAPEHWESLQDEFTNWRDRRAEGLEVKPWHPLESFESDGIQIDDASIRLKGNPCCSWTSDKMQFVIGFDQQDEDGRFKGLRKLALDAPPYDPSVLRERVSLSYMRDAGFAASCSNHATLTIDGTYYGLYTNIESVDREFLEREFPGDEPFGSLYKWDYLSSRFQKRNQQELGNADLTEYLAIDTMEEMEALVDTEQAYRFWAAESVIGQSDGYWAGSINFYLYHHPERGWQWIPWDLDHAITWWSARRDPFRRTDFHGAAPLVDLLFSSPTGRVQFAEAIDDAHRHHDVEVLVERTDRWAAQIRELVAREPHRAFTMDEFDGEVLKIKRRLNTRHGYLCGRDLDDDDFGPSDEAIPTP